jgi:galactose mutarotase-like enzyme
MSYHYEIFDSAVGPLDQIVEESSGLRLVISRTGAEPVSLALKTQTGAWEGFLWRDGEVEKPDSGWGNHATVMGYFVHRLWEQRSVYEGHEIKGGTHGFLRHHLFGKPIVDLQNGSLTYCVEPSEIPAQAYPYKVALRLVYTLNQGKLEMRFVFENRESHPVVLSFGWHPGFAVGSLESARLLMPAGTYRREMAPGDFLDNQTEEIDFAGGEMPFEKADLPASYLLDLSGVPKSAGRRFVLEAPSLGHRVLCDYTEAPYLTLWSNGDPFLCVEPCWGLPDSNPPVPFEKKKGLVSIAGGETLTAAVYVTPSFLRK